MATSLHMPTIARKKRVPNKYNPNTYRVTAYDENDEPLKYPETSSEVREKDPLGVHLNKRPDMLQHQSQVLPYDLTDYRANRPFPKKCNFLRQNSRSLNEPICHVETKGQPKGHWIAPQLPSPTDAPLAAYTFDTVFRKDFCRNQNKNFEKCMQSRATDTTKNASSKKGFHLNNLQEKDVNIKEKISYEHCYDSRYDKNYPLRGKRHGSFVWTKKPEPSMRSWSYFERHLDNDDSKLSKYD